MTVFNQSHYFSKMKIVTSDSITAAAPSASQSHAAHHDGHDEETSHNQGTNTDGEYLHRSVEQKLMCSPPRCTTSFRPLDA